MNRTSTLREDDPIAMQAGAWLIDLQSPDVPVQKIAQWQQWLAADERHRRTYQELQALWQQAEGLAPSSLPDDAQVEADRYEPSQTVSAWRASGAVSVRRERRRLLAGGLALAATVSAIWIGGQLADPLMDLGVLKIETNVAQNREMVLPDGSRMFVGAKSSVLVRMHAHEREVVLQGGEAYFEVAKDPSRPFYVRAGTAAVTALGTAFNVRRTGTQVVVAVSQGAVEVRDTAASKHSRTSSERPARLDAGQKIVLEPARPDPTIESIATQAVASWREGRLQFSGEPLAAVVADVNRYAGQPITIKDPRLKGLRITGTVSADNIESWLKSLEKALPVRVSTAQTGTLELRSVD